MFVSRLARVLQFGLILACASCATDPPAQQPVSSGSESSSGSSSSSSSEGSDSESSSSTTAPACVPVAEECNGIDDDCDDAVDEPEDIEGAGDECFIAGLLGECSRGVSVCRGSTTLSCESDIEAADEFCDGLDNDCNGLIDDEPLDETLGVDCETELPGQCTLGRFQCSAGEVKCLNINPISPERCDGRDNNCDGEIDEGNPEGGGLCNTGLPGICRDGARTCLEGTMQCAQAITADLEETCGDNLDNNCNGTTDEGCCAHSPCVTGVALVASCHPCVGQICAVDSFCCQVAWDGICVSEVQSVCGLQCPI